MLCLAHYSHTLTFLALHRTILLFPVCLLSHYRSLVAPYHVLATWLHFAVIWVKFQSILETV
jgi:hypothetical protein